MIKVYIPQAITAAKFVQKIEKSGKRKGASGYHFLFFWLFIENLDSGAHVRTRAPALEKICPAPNYDIAFNVQEAFDQFHYDLFHLEHVIKLFYASFMETIIHTSHIDCNSQFEN